MNPIRTTRLPALDGVRGILALLVVVDHVCITQLRSLALDPFAQLAVWSFFVMSALVLARQYDGRYGPFLLRRALRLLPVYVVCWAAGCAAAGQLLTPAVADAPTWSMTVEGIAMIFFPVILWFAATNSRFVVICLVLLVAMLKVHAFFVYPVFFLIGARLSEAEPRWKVLEGRVVQFFGRISYSLYLSHYVVLTALGMPGLALVVPVAWLLTRTVDQRAIAWSRLVAAGTRAPRGA